MLSDGLGLSGIRGWLARPWIRWLIVLSLLWLLFAQALVAARAASITFDEGPHLAVGYATLRSGDLRLQPVHIHPPLANMLAAAPLLLDPALPAPQTVPGWEIASLSALTDAIIWQYPHPARLALPGRLPVILLTVLTGAIVLRWAMDLGMDLASARGGSAGSPRGGSAGSPRSGSAGSPRSGWLAGLLALTLYVFDPNILAHGSLVTTDMAVTFFGLSTFFLAHRYLRRPSRARLAGVGVALGLALASKVSALLLIPLVGLVLVVGRWRREESFGRAWRPGATAGLIALVIAFGTLWAVYGFELRSLPWLLPSIPLPAATHLEIYRSLQQHYQLGHSAFLMGQNGTQGWWLYFPVAFAIKTPLPILTLLVVALILFIRRFVRRRQPVNLPLLLFPSLYVATSLFSSVDIGYRHLLPILPFLYIFIGVQLRNTQYAIRSFYPEFVEGTHHALTSRACRGTRLTSHASRLTLLLWLIIGTLLVQPFPLTYFNEIAGGPGNGYRWLVDSNLDWGQNLWQLRDWMREEDVARVYYSHYSPARPAMYGVDVDWLPPQPQAGTFAPFNPAPGVYAIGATTLQGVYTPDVNTFAFFRNRPPEDVLGHALFLYRVAQQGTPEWAAVCFNLSLDEGWLRAGLGRPDLRIVYYDCAQSRFYAAAGAGRLVLPPQMEVPPGAEAVLETRRPSGETDWRMVEVEGPSLPPEIVPATTVEGPLDLLGYRLDHSKIKSEDTFLLETYWQVVETPNRPLSLMGHLVGPDSLPVAVADGLGVPVEQWQPEDVIVQQHRFVLPEGAKSSELWVQTGAYWLDTGDRWAIQYADGTSSDHLTLDKITIMD